MWVCCGVVVATSGLEWGSGAPPGFQHLPVFPAGALGTPRGDGMGGSVSLCRGCGRDFLPGGDCIGSGSLSMPFPLALGKLRQAQLAGLVCLELQRGVGQQGWMGGEDTW